jgi:hypothetical protein
MGASVWEYFVPYQESLGQALQELRQRVFTAGDYWWYGEDESLPESLRAPRPERLEDVFDDEIVREEGTHSILDVFRILEPGEMWDYNTVVPTTAEEARRATGTDRPRRADAVTLDEALERQRWVGRCAVLYDEHGDPSEIMFWGHSGD